jgi:WD40 repeat protein
MKGDALSQPIDIAQSKSLAEYATAAPLLSCVFDPTGRFLFAGGRTRGVTCVDVEAASVSTLEGHDSWVVAAVRAGVEWVATADQAGRLIAWECGGELPRMRWNISAHPGAIYSLATSSDGERLATGDRDGTIRLWSTTDGSLLHEWRGETLPATALVFHPDGKRLISADRQPKKPRLHWRDIATGMLTQSKDLAALSAYRRVEDIEWGGIRGLAISLDGKQLVAMGENEYAGPACALLLDGETGEQQRRLASPLKGFYYRAAFRESSGMGTTEGSVANCLLTAGGDVGKGELRCWNLSEENSSSVFNTPGPCMSFDLHPDGRRLALALAIGKGTYPDAGKLMIRDSHEGNA